MNRPADDLRNITVVIKYDGTPPRVTIRGPLTTPELLNGVVTSVSSVLNSTRSILLKYGMAEADIAMLVRIAAARSVELALQTDTASMSFEELRYTVHDESDPPQEPEP